MSWSDPCSNCGQPRADCDCGDWNGYKAKEEAARKAKERYPMCEDQPAQIDCRNIDCKFHQNAACTNVSPALTLSPARGVEAKSGWMYVTCWSFEQKQQEDNHGTTKT